jgi:LysW-gamma-L-lysine carboxypeptidase
MSAIELLESLLRHYSPTHHEQAAVAYLVSWMQAHGLRAHCDEIGNAIGVAGDGPRQIVLLGHIDTVPGEIPVRREGDRLHGRGAVDAKGPLAAFAAAVARLSADDLAGKTVIVIGAVGEEGDSRGAHFIKDRYRPAYTVIGEPSGWHKLTLGYKGSVWFDYRVQRSLAHTSAQVQSACEAAVAYWNAVGAWAAEFNRERPKMFDQVRPTLRTMRSGSDGFMEWAELALGLRLPPGLTVVEASEAMTALVVEADLRATEGVDAWRSDKNNPLVRSLLRAIRAAGGEPAFSVKSGTADMNIVAPLWQTPILAYGPGDSALDHTPNEHIGVSEYERAVDVLTQALVEL